MAALKPVGPAPGRQILPPRAFHQSINPLKRARVFGDALKRADEDYADYLNSKVQARPPSGVCFGFFWDSVNKKQIRVFLGTVSMRSTKTFAYAPASPLAAPAQVENLSRVGAGPYANFSTSEERPERSEDAPQQGENSPGPYVIPGQSLMGETKHTKTGGQNLTGETFEWSVEKCEAELC